MKKPRDLAEAFDTPESTAKWLEALAADIRTSDPNKLIAIDMTIRWWHPDWEDKKKRGRWVQDPNVMTHAVCQHGVTKGQCCPNCEAVKQ